MPRIYSQPDNEPLDFCLACYSDLDVEADYPDGDWEAAHPPYDETEYICQVCNKKLTEEDD